MRTRYAVVSALSTANYVPSDAEHVGFFKTHWPHGVHYETIPCERTPHLCYMTNAVGDELLVPFEWFELAGPPHSTNDPSACPDSILLLWLDSNAFEDYPSRRLAQLIAALKELPVEYAGDPNQIHFKLLDPSLITILEEPIGLFSRYSETSDPSPLSVTNVLNGLQIYSAWSTTADALLVTNATAARRGEVITKRLRERGFELINVTATDDELTWSLIEELARRGVDLSNTNNHVALLSESDTFYGRALPLTFVANAIRATTNEPFANIVTNLQKNSRKWPEHIHLSTYLRGVDGRLPGEVASKTEPGKQAPDKAKAMEELERPEGPSQLDYMPRLALELREHEKEYLKKGETGFKAIGILGSDVYDKLLLLQSLHNLFPGALFFTTDLDARLLHPRELKWSRNLIIASSFDFKLDDSERVEHKAPPFRDTYQTAQYLATLAAFGMSDTNDLNAIKPRLFEVGRDGAYNLDPPPRRDHSANSDHSIYPQRERLEPHWLIIAVSAAAAVLAALLFIQYCGPVHRCFFRTPEEPAGATQEKFFQTRFSALTRRTAWSLGATVGVFLLLGGLLGFLIWLDHHREGGEPFSLLAGISLWPTDVLNLFAASLSVFFLIKAVYDLRRNGMEIEQEFFLSSPASFEKKPSGWRARARSFVRALWPRRENSFWLWRCPDKEINAFRLWNDGRHYADIFNRFGRSTRAALLCLLLGACLFGIFGWPFRPYRGAVNCWTDFFVSGICVTSVVLLLFFIVDATLLCNTFVNYIAKWPTVWPEDLLKKVAAERGMHPNDLPEWLDIQIIAKRTDVVSRLIFYPFVVLGLMIVARNSFFDHFDWPISMILFFGVLGGYAVSCALTLRCSAEKAQKEELRQLNEKYLRMKADKNYEIRAKQIELTMAEIRDIEEGAFVPLSQHPVIAALAMPFGGASIVGALDYFAQ